MVQPNFSGHIINRVQLLIELDIIQAALNRKKPGLNILRVTNKIRFALTEQLGFAKTAAQLSVFRNPGFTTGKINFFNNKPVANTNNFLPMRMMD